MGGGDVVRMVSGGEVVVVGRRGEVSSVSTPH